MFFFEYLWAQLWHWCTQVAGKVRYQLSCLGGERRWGRRGRGGGGGRFLHSGGGLLLGQVDQHRHPSLLHSLSPSCFTHPTGLCRLPSVALPSSVARNWLWNSRGGQSWWTSDILFSNSKRASLSTVILEFLWVPGILSFICLFLQPFFFFFFFFSVFFFFFFFLSFFLFVWWGSIKSAFQFGDFTGFG